MSPAVPMSNSVPPGTLMSSTSLFDTTAANPPPNVALILVITVFSVSPAVIVNSVSVPSIPILNVPAVTASDKPVPVLPSVVPVMSAVAVTSDPIEVVPDILVAVAS